MFSHEQRTRMVSRGTRPHRPNHFEERGFVYVFDDNGDIQEKALPGVVDAWCICERLPPEGGKPGAVEGTTWDVEYGTDVESHRVAHSMRESHDWIPSG